MPAWLPPIFPIMLGFPPIWGILWFPIMALLFIPWPGPPPGPMLLDMLLGFPSLNLCCTAALNLGSPSCMFMDPLGPGPPGPIILAVDSDIALAWFMAEVLLTLGVAPLLMALLGTG